MRPTRTILLLILLTLPAIGADCVSDDGGSSAPPREPERIERPSSEADVDPLAIPREAEVAEEFDPGDFEWRADASGQVWIYDRKNRRTIDTTDIRRGEVLKVSPRADRIWVDGDTRSRARMFEDAEHRVYILADRRRDRDERRDDDRPREARLPRGAEIAAEGRGVDLSYRAKKRGTIYVYDVARERVLYKTSLGIGERFTLSPEQDSAVIDRKTVWQGPLSTRADYELYWVRD